MLPINLISKNLIYFFQLFFGFLIIIYTIYVRLIVKRLPRDLYIYDSIIIDNDLIYKINYLLLIMILVGILISLFNISTSLFFIINNYNISDTKLKQFFSRIVLIIKNALIEVYYLILEYIPEAYKYFSILAHKFYKNFGYRNNAFFINIILSIRLLIVVVFLIDIFYFFKLNYFYKVIGLLIVPLILDFFFFLLKDFSENKEKIASFLQITVTLNSDNLPAYTFRCAPGYESIDLDYCINEYLLCLKLEGYLSVFNSLKTKYSSWMNIVIYSLYFFGWTYIILVNIGIT